jgi:putative transposase
MGLEAIYQAPRTSDPHPAHRIYPYLLKGMGVNAGEILQCLAGAKVQQVWK